MYTLRSRKDVGFVMLKVSLRDTSKTLDYGAILCGSRTSGILSVNDRPNQAKPPREQRKRKIFIRIKKKRRKATLLDLKWSSRLGWLEPAVSRLTPSLLGAVQCRERKKKMGQDHAKPINVH